jgi:hypothetical protein
VNLDVFWLRKKSLEDSDDQPAADVLRGALALIQFVCHVGHFCDVQQVAQ